MKKSAKSTAILTTFVQVQPSTMRQMKKKNLSKIFPGITISAVNRTNVYMN